MTESTEHSNYINFSPHLHGLSDYGGVNSLLGQKAMIAKKGLYMKRSLYGHERQIDLLFKSVREWADSADVELVRAFYEDMVLQDLSVAQQLKYFIRLRVLYRFFKKSMRGLCVDDVRRLVFNLKLENVSPATIKMYLQTIKRFFERILSEKSPVQNIKLKIKTTYTKEILVEEDIMKLSLACCSSRDKAIVNTLWDTGARVGELLNMSTPDVNHTQKTIRLEGKTGERFIPVFSYLPFIKAYVHACPVSSGQYVWRTGIKNETLTYDGFIRQLQKIAKRAGVNKSVNPHHFRHSRATDLADKGMTEYELRLFFGWTQDSDVPCRYIHMSGKHLRERMMVINGMKPKESVVSKLAAKNCECGELNSYLETCCVVCKTRIL